MEKSGMEQVFAQPWTKTYNFLSEDGLNILALEQMSDTPYSFTLPAQLLALLIKDEDQLYEEMQPLAQLDSPAVTFAEEMLHRHQELRSCYAAACDRYRRYDGPFFKRSTLKGDVSLEFVPVNLHLQRLQVQNQTLLDVVTVGAFTAYAQHFKDGGLQQMRDRLNFSGRSVDAGDKASAVYQADNTVDTIEGARMAILMACGELLESVQHESHIAEEKTIRSQSSRIETALLSTVITEGYKFLVSNGLENPPVIPEASLIDERLGSLPPAPPCLVPWPEIGVALLNAAASVTSSTGNGRLAALSTLCAATDAALSAARLARAVARLREERRTQQLRDSARHRRDVCFCQAVSAACVALLARLWCRPLEPSLLQLWASAGPLLQFEGLLSYYGNEAHMVQDMVVAVQDLETVQFIVRPILNDAQETSQPEVEMEGGRGRLRVVLPAPRQLFAFSSASEISFRVCAVFFNVGINEQATFAEYVAGAAPQRAVNEEGFRKLAHYVNNLEHQQLGSQLRCAAGSDDVSDLVVQLGQQLVSPQAKNVAVLQLAAQICRRVSGLRFTSCKSAKDRTSMSVTLEQVNVLTSECRLAASERQRALTIMRTEGSRRHNALKNVGSPRFSFHTLQLLTMPPEYRPPAGTYGAVQS